MVSNLFRCCALRCARWSRWILFVHTHIKTAKSRFKWVSTVKLFFLPFDKQKKIAYRLQKLIGFLWKMVLHRCYDCYVSRVVSATKMSTELFHGLVLRLCFECHTTTTPTSAESYQKLLLIVLPTVAVVLVVAIAALIAWRERQEQPSGTVAPPSALPKTSQQRKTVQSPGANYFYLSPVVPNYGWIQPPMLQQWRRAPPYWPRNLYNGGQWISRGRPNNVLIPASPYNWVV